MGLPPPFWAFAWAGGQGLARWLLDNPAEVAGKRVLDLAAGSGLVGVTMFISGAVEKIILSRPAVEAGERLGFLPGDAKEKVDPYMQPLYDALNDFLPSKQVEKLMQEKRIEIAPLAFMRGRTL